MYQRSVTSYKNPNLGDGQFDMKVLIALFSSKISQNTDDIVIKTKSRVFFSLHKSKTFFKMKHEKKKASQKNKKTLKIVMYALRTICYH